MNKMEVAALFLELKEIKALFSELKEKIDPKPSGIKLSEWLLTWRDIYKQHLKQGSIVPINSCIKNHIPEDIKSKCLDELTPEMIQIVLNRVPTSRTRKDTYDVFKAALNKAFELGKMNANVMCKVVPIVHKRKKGKALSLDEQRELLSKDKSMIDLFLFYILTGCRRSEALSVTLADFDFKNKLLHIQGTKTELSDREVPLFPETIALLQKIKLPADKNTPIFKYNSSYVTHYFKKQCPNHKLHDLRHTFATRCLENGINIKVVQQWLGHTKIETTANIYMHVTEKLEKSETQKFSLEPTFLTMNEVASLLEQLEIVA